MNILEHIYFSFVCFYDLTPTLSLLRHFDLLRLCSATNAQCPKLSNQEREWLSAFNEASSSFQQGLFQVTLLQKASSS
jgi:hypothetical protein